MRKKRDIKKIVEKIVVDYIKFSNKICESVPSCMIEESYVEKIVFAREGRVCISNESNLSVYGYDVENDWELTDQLCSFIQKRLNQKKLLVEYNMGAFEVYEDE